jgi:hypothetical protein
MLALLGVLAGIGQAISSLPYIRDVLRRKTRPHRATWFIWWVLSAVVFASQRADGARWSLALVAAQFVGTLVIFCLSLRLGEGGGTLVDVLLLSVAGLGVVGWRVAGDPVIATGCVVLADLIAVALMLPKTVRDPRSETLSTYVLGVASVIMAAAAVGSFAPRLLLYPAYLAIADSSVAALIVIQRRRLPPV